MRGSALTLAEALEELGGWQPDLVLVSGMIDLAQFRTFARGYIGDPATILYLHESQITYPTYKEGGLVEGLKAALADPVAPMGLSAAMHRYSWGQMAPVYDQRFAESAAGPKRP
jgi:hypothetical protein